MSNKRYLPRWLSAAPNRPIALVGLVLGVAVGCSDESAPGGGGMYPGTPGNTDAGSTPPTPPEDGSSSPDGGADGANPPMSPFKSLEVAANAPATFAQPQAGVPLPGGSVAFLATVETDSDEERAEMGVRVGVWLQPAQGALTLLYAGDKLVSPFDIDASVDGKTLYIADFAAGADGGGAILSLSTTGGEPTEVVSGFSPHAVTVADNDQVYFSGVDDVTREPGVFVVAGNSASRVFAGPPLVDPSGIAVRKDGSVFVADMRLSDRELSDTTPTLSGEAGVVLIKDGQASIFVTGFATGCPAGIALTTDEKSLIISGEGPDRSDTVYIYDVANPQAPPTVVTDKFSAYQDSSAGLKRAHDSNTFIWASLAANRGTVYRFSGN